jgi:hypothetical protein
MKERKNRNSSSGSYAYSAQSLSEINSAFAELDSISAGSGSWNKGGHKSSGRGRKGRNSRKYSVFPERIQRIGRRHPDWSFQILSLIYARKVVPGMTLSQVREAIGRPSKVVRNKSDGNDRSALWYYTKGPLVSVDLTANKVVRVW